MSVKQISVFLENKPGALKDLTGVLADNGIDMRAFSLAETSDFGIARIIVDDTYKTTTVLRDAEFIHSVSTVIAVIIPDVPGGLDKVLAVLADCDVNVEYMYAFLGKKDGSAYMVFRVTDEQKAERALNGKGIHIVDQEELSEI